MSIICDKCGDALGATDRPDALSRLEAHQLQGCQPSETCQCAYTAGYPCDYCLAVMDGGRSACDCDASIGEFCQRCENDNPVAAFASADYDRIVGAITAGPRVSGDNIYRTLADIELNRGEENK